MTEAEYEGVLAQLQRELAAITEGITRHSAELDASSAAFKHAMRRLDELHARQRALGEQWARENGGPEPGEDPAAPDRPDAPDTLTGERQMALGRYVRRLLAAPGCAVLVSGGSPTGAAPLCVEVRIKVPVEPASPVHIRQLLVEGDAL